MGYKLDPPRAIRVPDVGTERDLALAQARKMLRGPLRDNERIRLMAILIRYGGEEKSGSDAGLSKELDDLLNRTRDRIAAGPLGGDPEDSGQET